MLCQSDMYTSVRVFDESKTNIDSLSFGFVMNRRDIWSIWHRNWNLCSGRIPMKIFVHVDAVQWRGEKKKENNLSSIWPRTSRIICPSVLEMNVKNIDKVDLQIRKIDKKKCRRIKWYLSSSAVELFFSVCQFFWLIFFLFYNRWQNANFAFNLSCMPKEKKQIVPSISMKELEQMIGKEKLVSIG